MAYFIYMNLFNYLGELKKDLKLPDNIFNSYNLINISGHILYVEGHCGIITIKSEEIVFNVKKGKKISVKGNELKIKILLLIVR